MRAILSLEELQTCEVTTRCAHQQRCKTALVAQLERLRIVLHIIHTKHFASVQRLSKSLL